MTSTGHGTSPLAHLGPQWFAPVMGWSGLAMAWHRAADRFGETAHLVSMGCALLAAAIFVAVTIATIVRARLHPGALAADFKHPVRHGFVAAFPVSVILISTNALLHDAPLSWAEPAWLFGVCLQFAVTVWVIARWIGGRVQWPSLTPILYIPIIGNVLVPLAGLRLGYPGLSWFFFGIGVFFWPVLTALMLARLAHQPLPQQLLPSWFITIAPPAVAGSAAIGLGMSDTLLPAVLGVAAVFTLACVVRAPAIVRGPFGMPAWAVSFPLAALTALTLRAAPVATAAGAIGILLLAITSVVLVGLTIATYKGLRNGTLLVGEPAASIQPAPASQP